MCRTLPKHVVDQGTPPHRNSGAVGSPANPTVSGGLASYVLKPPGLASLLSGTPVPGTSK